MFHILPELWRNQVFVGASVGALWKKETISWLENPERSHWCAECPESTPSTSESWPWEAADNSTGKFQHEVDSWSPARCFYCALLQAMRGYLSLLNEQMNHWFLIASRGAEVDLESCILEPLCSCREQRKDRVVTWPAVRITGRWRKASREPKPQTSAKKEQKNSFIQKSEKMIWG